MSATQNNVTEDILRANANKCNLDFEAYNKLLFSKTLTESEIDGILEKYRFFGNYDSDSGEGSAEEDSLKDENVSENIVKVNDVPKNGETPSVQKVAESHVCDVCNKTFKNKYSVDLHKYTVHTIEKNKKFECDVSHCGERFSIKSALVKHKMTVHLNDKILKGKSGIKGKAPPKTTVKPSVRNRAGSEVCEICNKWFISKYGVNAHIERVHLMIKKYECGVNGCDQKFHKKSDMVKHKTIVHLKDIIKCHNDDKELLSNTNHVVNPFHVGVLPVAVEGVKQVPRSQF